MGDLSAPCGIRTHGPRSLNRVAFKPHDGCFFGMSGNMALTPQHLLADVPAKARIVSSLSAGFPRDAKPGRGAIRTGPRSWRWSGPPTNPDEARLEGYAGAPCSSGGTS